MNYINNDLMLKNIKYCLAMDKLNSQFYKDIDMLMDKLGKNYNQLSYYNDIKQDALIIIMKEWIKFDPERSNNAFAWYSSLVINALRAGYKLNMNWFKNPLVKIELTGLNNEDERY